MFRNQFKYGQSYPIIYRVPGLKSKNSSFEVVQHSVALLLAELALVQLHLSLYVSVQNHVL